MLFCLLLLCMFSCKRQTRLEEALSLAGENRSELEKVLLHYSMSPADSLKLRSAKYLVENMTYHRYYSGEAADIYYGNADSLFAQGIIHVPDMQSKLDSLYRESMSRKMILNNDIQNIKSSFMMSRIDHAFSTEKYPWSRCLPFNDFCEYILPYRIYSEPPDDWWSDCSVRFEAVIDSCLRSGITSDSAICRHITETWTKPIRYKYVAAHYDLPYNVLSKMTNGTCKELVQLGIYIMRSFGIPVVCDYTPQWANRSQGHEWNALLYDGKAIPFVFGEPGDFGDHISKRVDRAAKIYRKVYSLQPETLIMQNPNEDIPPFFRNPFMRDVSEMYFTPRDAMIELTIPPPAKKKIAYIMVFNNKQWVAVHWAWIKRKKALFTRMAEGCAYTVMYFHNNQFYPASRAFFIDSDTIRYFEPDMERVEDIVLKRKHPELGSWAFKELMVAGEFQGANCPDFSDAVTIYRIDSVPESSYNFVELEHPCCFRYFRYMPPAAGTLSASDGSAVGRQKAMKVWQLNYKKH